MRVAIIMGSKSDAAVMKKAAEVFDEFGVEYSAHILSAHRAPELLGETVKKLEDGGTELIIAGAGLAAHLPGVIASRTLLPVIGVPVASGGLWGMDALLSIVQMPKPIPVAAVGVDNAANAGYLGVAILSLKYPDLRKKLAAFRIKMKADFARENADDPFSGSPGV
ncbi:MAG: 5-(carboxyamino)imidazole ribonucleotide mutase [Treponema sp.]|jgi:5-(carboxyamino)imidazole ribonucleotide mutase|nr:5-(carboxyamino)imidazole ribonucleotide mutase [Treponema sp.]